MCGIVGFIAEPGGSLDPIRAMTDAIAHRGPDEEGFWTDPEAGLAFGHRRLSIIELSSAGSQPMASRDGRYVLIFNGEIYNHAALRAQLEAAGAPGGAWRGHSDTEVLVEAIAAWGLNEALARSTGMFALALWDRSERLLQLAIDRFGEKPLYYGWSGNHFLFASELKAMRLHPAFAGEIDRGALSMLAARAYIPAPLSIYANVAKLRPGTILTASPGVHREPRARMRPGEAGGRIGIEPYWQYRDVVTEGLARPFTSESEALEALEAALVKAVCDQSVADVPVGTFLSGGIDSSTVVALLQAHSSSQVKTFSIGFEQSGYDEAGHAKAVARHFGTDHHELYVNVDEARNVIPLLPAMYDEPFADSSQIPTYLVAQFAGRHVKVALSGDGGDELFGGYNRYMSASRLWSLLGKMPAPLRQLLGGAAGALPPAFWNNAAAIVERTPRADHFGTKVQKGLRTIGRASELTQIFGHFIDPWSEEGSPVLGAGDAGGLGAFDFDLGQPAPDVVRMMYCDATAYLPGDILCKVDRAAMAVSLETRVPLLDPEVAAVAARIPLHMKIRNGEGKWILRQLLYAHAPRALFERPKAGFAVPIGQWLRGPLRDWAEGLIAEPRLAAEGYFDPVRVRRRWSDHLANKREDAEALWPILMFQAWLGER